jgi:hypothetical protein
MTILSNATFLMKKLKILTLIPQNMVFYNIKNVCHRI